MNKLPENSSDLPSLQEGNNLTDLAVSEKTGEILSNQKVVMQKQDESINFTPLEERVINELDKTGMIDLKFIFSEEVLIIAKKLLKKLLQLERNKFYKLLEIKNEDINFSIFEDDDRLGIFFGLIAHAEGVQSSDITREIIEEFQQEYIEFGDEVSFSKRFYEIHLICRDNGSIGSEEKRILDLAIRSFERNGINLPEEKQERLKEINKQTAQLSFDFANNVLDSEKEFHYIFGDDNSIKDMPKDILESAKELAKKDGIEGYKFLSNYSDYASVMRYCTNPDVRRYFFEERRKFGSVGKHDNRPIILELLKLRQEQAKLLGFNNYGELSLDEKMAQSPKQVIDQETAISVRARVKAEKEINEIKDFFNIENLNSWDMMYYIRLIKEIKYEVSDKILREYFEYEKVLEGLFNIAKILYDVEFREIEMDMYGKNVKVFEAYKGGELKAYFVMDMYYSPQKQSGAWANELRNKNIYKGKTTIPILVNVCSFQKLEEATLLNYSDVNTMFHEFGHAMHKILSESKYSQLSGGNVEWDFIELPSQLMENWCDPEGLKFFASHYKTGQVMSEELINKLEKLKTSFNGADTLYFNAMSKLDMLLHTEEIPKTVEELDQLFLDIFNSIAIFKANKENKAHASFSHIFDGAYAAGFYSYLRAEIIEADVFGEFKKNGIFDKTTAERFLHTILSQGTRKPAIELFRDFMGREPNLDAFFEKKGF